MIISSYHFFQTIVRGGRDGHGPSANGQYPQDVRGISIARSNSLRRESPPPYRRKYQGDYPSLPEDEMLQHQPPYPDHHGQQYPHGGSQGYPGSYRDQGDYPGEYSPRNNYRDPRDQGRYPPPPEHGRGGPYENEPRRDYDYQDQGPPRPTPRGNNNFHQDPRDYRDGTIDRRHPQQHPPPDYSRGGGFNNSYDQRSDPSRDNSFDRDPYTRNGPRDNYNHGMDNRRPPPDDRYRQVLPNGGPPSGPNRYNQGPPPQHQPHDQNHFNSLPRSQPAEQYQRVS